MPIRRNVRHGARGRGHARRAHGLELHRRVGGGLLRLDDVGELLALQHRLLLRGELLFEERLHEAVQRDRGYADLALTNERLDVGLHRARALVAIELVLRERLHDDLLELDRVVRTDVARARVLALADQSQRLVFARALEEPLPRGELEEHDAGREDVAPEIDGLAPRLLWRHVRDLAFELSALRRLRRLRVALGDTEVDDLHVTRERDDDVLRRDVSMHDVELGAVELVLLVRIRETGAHAEHDRERVLERELEDVRLLHLAHERAEVFSVHVLHRDEVLTVDLTDVEDLDDVRMRERCRDARLVEQHVDERLVLVHRRKDPFDDEELLESRDALLDREEQLRHASRRELADERVLAESARHAVHSFCASFGSNRRLGWRRKYGHPSGNPKLRAVLGQSRLTSGFARVSTGISGGVPSMNWRVFIAVATLSTAASATPVLKGPWVQKVSASSAEVRVELDGPGTASVEIDGRTIEDKESTAFHVVKIGGLAAGTRYPFTVHTRGVAMQGALTTAPKDDSPEPFRFLIYGDNRSDEAAHQAVVRAMVPVKTDFLVHTGDFVENGRVASQWQTFFDIEEPLLRDRCLFSAVGNHEIFDGGGVLYTKYFGPGDPPTELDGTQRWGNTRFFFLNSLVQYKAGADREWLERVLKAADDEPGLVWRIVVMHHNIWSSGPHGDNLYLRDAGIPALFRAHKIDLLLAGHDHIYERGIDDHVAYVVTGGGGAPTYRIKTPKASARKLESVRHFVVATIDKDRIALEAIRVDGSTIEKCGLTKQGWDCGKGLEPDTVTATTGDPSAPASPPKKSKCGCDAPGAGTERWPWLAAMGIAALAGRRRMKRCARSS